VQAALVAGLEPVEVLVDAERPPELPGLGGAEQVDPKLLAEVSALGHPPRVLGIFRKADLPRLRAETAPPVGLGLWHVGDPGNIGTLLRTADGLGPAFVTLSGGSADVTSPKALRASAGSVFRVPVGLFDESPAPRVALVVHGGIPLPELQLGERATFVLGAEREGLPDDVIAGCDAVATIPLAAGAESLNVAVTGALALYEWRRRHG
jgi:TrmH family RNA methyltransferase